MQNFFEENSTLVQCLRTLVEMVQDRGYNFDPESLSSVNEILNNPEKIKSWLQHYEKIYKPVLSAVKINDPEKTLYIYWPLSGKIPVDVVRHYLKQITSDQQSAILVVRRGKNREGKKFGLTPFASTCLENAKGHFSIFALIDIYRNITRHSSHQPHRLLSDEEWSIIRKKQMINPDRMPDIFHTDPVVRYYGFPIGSIIEITRNYGGTLLEEKYYRRVVKNTT